MLLLLSSSIIMATTGILISKNLLEYKGKLKWIEVLFAILLVFAPAVIFYDEKYNAILPLVTFILLILSYQSLFKVPFSTSFLLATFVLLLTALVDLIWSIFAMCFIDVEFFRENTYTMIMSNIGISLIAALLSKTPILKNMFKRLMKIFTKKSYILPIIFTVLFIGAIAILHSNMFTIFETNQTYTISLIVLLLFFLLYYIYIIEKVNYDKLNDEYDALFECIQTFEDWLDKEQLGIHEMKNNLSIIRGMTNDKKIYKKIDNMLQESIVIEKDWVEQLKNIPKGGIKGLIYYKMAVARNKKVNLYVEISSKIQKHFKEISEENTKRLCILLGIYLDNAIESAEKSKKRQVTLEIYYCNESIVFAISNSYGQKPQLHKINIKGYTTKGEGHGKGLYFAQKMLNKNKTFIGTQQVLNDYYIQKLILPSK